ncbi:hypothetical protein D3C81_967160 [compost metagenome]
MAQRQGVRAKAHAQPGAPDVVVEGTQALLPLVNGLVVVEAAKQRQVIAQRPAQAGAGVVLVPHILEAAAEQADADVLVEGVVAATVGDPRRIDRAAIEGHEIFPQVAGHRLAHGMQAPALQGQALDAGVLQGHAAKALRQQARVAGSHHRVDREYIAHPHHRIEQAHFRRAAHLGVFVTGLAVAIDRQHVERTAPAIAAAAGIELEAEHGERVQANANGPLGEARFEAGNDRMGPGF